MNKIKAKYQTDGLFFYLYGLFFGQFLTCCVVFMQINKKIYPIFALNYQLISLLVSYENEIFTF